MVYDLPGGDLNFLFRFGMQNIVDEDVTSDKFSMSIVAKQTNTIAPIVSRRQLFQGKSRTLLSIHILQVSDDKKIESVVIAGCDKAR